MSNRIEIRAPLPSFALWQAVVICAEKLRLAKAQTELL